MVQGTQILPCRKNHFGQHTITSGWLFIHQDEFVIIPNMRNNAKKSQEEKWKKKKKKEKNRSF